MENYYLMVPVRWVKYSLKKPDVSGRLMGALTKFLVVVRGKRERWEYVRSTTYDFGYDRFVGVDSGEVVYWAEMPEPPEDGYEG